MDDKILTNTLKVNLNRPISQNNFRVLGFTGIADGVTKLTRLYSNTDLTNNYIRIISLKFFYYADNSVWLREGAWDDKVFTPNANTRYSTVNAFTRIDSIFLEQLASTNQLQMLIDNNIMGVFPQTYFPMADEIDLNIITNSKLSDGIDFILNASFFSDQEGATILNPYVTILANIELVANKEPIYIEDK